MQTQPNMAHSHTNQKLTFDRTCRTCGKTCIEPHAKTTTYGTNTHARCSNVAANGVGKNVLGAQRLTLAGACARGSVSRATAGARAGQHWRRHARGQWRSGRYLAEGQATPRQGPRVAGRVEVEEPESRMDSGRSGGQHLDSEPLTAPSIKPESSRATDPRTGSEARRCGSRFGNGVGEEERTPVAATVAESSGA